MTPEARYRVLCVDDEPRILEGLQRTLDPHFEVTAFTSPMEALRALPDKQKPFAVVVSDMRMPIMDGAAFLAHARALSPFTTRILLTGQIEMDAAVAAVNQGNVFRFLCKPCSSDSLMMAINDAAEHHRLCLAERELLEQTLVGTIRILSDMLALVAPSVFAKTHRIKAYVLHMAQRLELPQPWRFELAASLSMVGCVGLAEQTLERVLTGKPLDGHEKRVFEEHPAIAHRLLAGIPRFKEIAEMVRLQQRNADASGQPPDVRAGAALLRVARDVDQLVESGMTVAAAIAELERKLPEAERPSLQQLADFQPPPTGSLVRPLRVAQMTAHMVLEDDVRTLAGVVVVPKGRELTTVLLERLWNFSRAGSLVEPIRVRVPG